MTARKRRRAVDDPFKRDCTACGARVNEPCRALDKHSKPLVSRATRLVHADRLEGEAHA